MRCKGGKWGVHNDCDGLAVSSLAPDLNSGVSQSISLCLCSSFGGFLSQYVLLHSSIGWVGYQWGASGDKMGGTKCL